jgi:hypothetical protein
VTITKHTIMNKLICLLRGHKWKLLSEGNYSKDGVVISVDFYYKCDRCLSTKKSYIPNERINL